VPRISKQLVNLSNVKATESILKKKDFHSVHAPHNLARVYKKLIKHHILSMPVYERTKSGKKRYIGFIDVVDVLHHALSVLSDVEMKEGFSTFSVKQSFAEKTAREVSNLSKRSPYLPLSAESTLPDVIGHFVRNKIHSIPLQSVDGNLIGIVTQSHLIRTLASVVHSFPFGNKTVGDLSLGFREVYTIGLEAQFGDAFKLMKDKGVSGIAVVNKNGDFVNDISVADLKLVGHNAEVFHKLLHPIQLVLEKLGPSGTRPTVINPRTSITEVLNKFLFSKIHRIYIVDYGTKKLKGVLTRSDIIHLFADYTKSEHKAKG